MLTLMADHDVEGQIQVLLRVFTSAEWHALWTQLAVHVESFASLGMPTHTPDAILWQFCQTQHIILIIGNRNEDGPASLEATLQASNKPSSLQVLTISEPQRLPSKRAYEHWVVERLVEYLTILRSV